MPLDHQKIERLREKAGLSQQRAAELAGLGSRQRWNQIVTGRNDNITLSTLQAIAKALGVDSRDLLK